MTTILEQAALAHFDALASQAGVSVRYARGNDDVELTAVPGSHVSEDYGEDGIAVVSRMQDWLIDPVDLVIDSATVKPEPGDRITTLDDREFAVAYADAENCWRWSDQTQKFMRVHTVEKQLEQDG